MPTNNRGDWAWKTFPAAWPKRWSAIAATALALMLASNAAGDVISGAMGCRFIGGSSGSTIISSTQTFLSCRFTADESITVDRFAIHLGSTIGNPAVVVRLRPDAGGIPGAVSLASVTQYPGALGAVAFEGAFGNSVSLTNGLVYHLVVNVTNATTVGVTNSFTARHLTGADFSLTPKTGRPDPMLNRLVSSDGGATWSPPAQQTNGTICVFALGNAIGQAVGQPLGQAYTTPGVGGALTRGQRFIYDGGLNYGVTSITVRVNKGAGNAADNLRVFILNNALNIISSNVLLSAGFTNTVAANYSVGLTNALMLTNGAVYNLVLESSGSSANSYVLYLPASILSNQFAATYQGTNGTAVNGSGLTTLNNTSTATTAYDMFFELKTLHIPPSGTIFIGR